MKAGIRIRPWHREQCGFVSCVFLGYVVNLGSGTLVIFLPFLEIGIKLKKGG